MRARVRVCVLFWDRFSLYSPGFPGSCFVDQGGLELRSSPASASQVLELLACTITAWLKLFLVKIHPNVNSLGHPLDHLFLSHTDTSNAP